MAEKSSIEWTDATWNPITGEVQFNEQWLDQPLRWRRPRKVFVCAHGDLFHEAVPDAWIDRVFAVMALCPQHTFQVLTKRPERMRAYCSTVQLNGRWLEMEQHALDLGYDPRGLDDHGFDHISNLQFLPNVWLGTSVEDQATLERRAPWLLETPAAVRFLSAEPLLGPLDLTDVDWRPYLDSLRTQPRPDPDSPNWPRLRYNVLTGHLKGPDDINLPKFDWVIVGGESGTHARPLHPDWARSLRDQCATAEIPFFFKQWGKWAPIEHSEAADEAGWQGRGNWMILDRTGELDIPDHRWPDEEAGEVAVIDVGKARAGHLLDGVVHHEMPEPAR